MKRLFALASLVAWLSACSAQPAGNRPGQVKVISHTPALSFVHWADPLENAFSSDVPSGWRTSGGLTRRSPIDTRSAIESVSADGQVRVAMGDAEFSSFMVPNPMLDATGFREGSRYPNGYGGFIPVMRHRPGIQFAEEYVRTARNPAK